MPTKDKGKKIKLFVPFDQEDFWPGNHGASYLNDIIWVLIEQVSKLEKQVKLLNTTR
jgi:hypothetical protein